MYSHVRVSILILSPVLMNRGTLISAPVSTVAGFVAFVAVSPLIPGSVSVTSRSTKVWRLYAEYCALVRKDLTYHVFLYELKVI